MASFTSTAVKRAQFLLDAIRQGPAPQAGRYLARRRGDRLNPSILSSRYHVLRQLAAALEALVDEPAVAPGGTLVDFGCGESPYAPIFARKFTRHLRADLPGNPHADVTMGADGTLPLEARSCDAVLSSQVLEHVSDPAAYLAEARRVLRPGGLLFLSTHGAWPYHPDPTDYWRWTRDGLLLELERAGFEPIAVRAVLGRAATAIQLLQDAVSAALPRPARPFVGFAVQPIIGVVERRRRDPAPADAAIYAVLARVR